MALWTKKKLTRIFPAKLEKVPLFLLLILQFNIYSKKNACHRSTICQKEPSCMLARMFAHQEEGIAPRWAHDDQCNGRFWFSKHACLVNLKNVNLSWKMFFASAARMSQGRTCWTEVQDTLSLCSTIFARAVSLSILMWGIELHCIVLHFGHG